MGTGEGMDEMEFTEAESNRTISSRSISNTRMQRQRRRVSLTRRRANMTCNLDRTALLACRLRIFFLRDGVPCLRRVGHQSALSCLPPPFGYNQYRLWLRFS